MSNYSKIYQFLHDLVLKNKIINKTLFEIEKILFLKKNIKIQNKSHIFITGMPRSGTTSLLNFLYLSGQYGSLVYRNLPFILSPNFSKFFIRKNIPIKKKERFHNDGIVFDIDSPEALDEIFFNNSKEYIKKELINYLLLILTASDKKKYLSKNNLNYKRINLIQNILPNSFFLISIRDPLQTARSLLVQHLHFSKLQKKNDFIRRYMKYLGHNEFGLDHIPWNKPKNFHDLNDINYWLEQWFLFYSDIYKKYRFYNNCLFIIYEKLTNRNYMVSILNKINCNKNEKLNFNFFKNFNNLEMKLKFSKNIYDKANYVYNKFKNEIKYNDQDN